MTLHAPQLIYLALVGIGTGAALTNHGRPKKGTENCITDLVATGLLLLLLWWGGFFR